MRGASGPKLTFRRQVTSTVATSRSVSADVAESEHKYVRTIGWITVLAAVAQALFGGLQWHLSKEGGEAMDKKVDTIVAAASQIASAAQTSNEQNRVALQETLTQAQKSMEANLQQAKGALDASIEASRTDQRAWLAFPKHKLMAEPGARAEVQLAVANRGKSPALVNSKGFIALWQKLPSEAFMGDWSGPTAVYPGQSDHALNHVLNLTPEQVEEYRAKRLKIYMRSLTCYEDIFGRTHWVKTCAFHVHGAPLDTFEFCPLGNEFGDDPKGKLCKGFKDSRPIP